MSRISESQAGSRNALAFLDMIAIAEGTRATRATPVIKSFIAGKSMWSVIMNHV